MSVEQVMIYVGYFAIIAGAIKAVQFLFSITPTGKLKEQVDKNTTNIDKDFKHLERIDNRIDIIDATLKELKLQHEEEIKDINESLEMIGSSMTAILNHMADGNGVDKLKEQRDKLIEYFIKREKR